MVRLGAFTTPLSARPPVFEVDQDGDGRVERRGAFRRGGGRFPDGGARC